MTDGWERRQQALARPRHVSWRWLRWPPTVAYALLLTSGAFKTDERLLPIPFDLTMGAAAVTLGYVLWRLFVVRNPLPKQALWLIVMFAAFAIPEFTAGPATDYGAAKVTNLFTLTFLAAIAPFFIIRNRRDAKDFFMVLGGLSVIISLDMVLQVLAGDSGRVTGFAGNPIWSGSMAGLGLLMAATAIMTRVVPNATGAILAVIASVALIGSGTRGALIGAIGGLVVAYPLSRASRPGARHRVALPVVVVLAFVASIAFSQERNLDRFADLTSGDFGNSQQFRAEAYSVTLTEISNTQSGIGWGRYGELRYGVGSDGAYPHNLILEVAVEGGWIPAAIMVFIIGDVFAIAIREGPKRPESVFAAALLAFTFVAAMFSGDINGNRLFFAMLGVVLALSRLETITGRPEPQPLPEEE